MKNKLNFTSDKPAIARPRRPRSSRQRILVVDEDSDVRLLYADALAGPDYRVDFAHDGWAGWEALQVASYDLLITEHAVSRLTGVELVTKLRAARMALPVVMVAAKLPTCELERNPSLQLVAMIEKPFAVNVLLDTVKNVLGTATGADGQITQQTNEQNDPMTKGWQLT